MASNNEKHEVTGLEVGFLIFGIGLTVFSTHYTITDGFSFLFTVKPKGATLTGIPGICILLSGFVMVYFLSGKFFCQRKKINDP
jgi:hypothetical protein